MTDYLAVLLELYADHEWSLTGDSYDGLEWIGETPKPTKKMLDDAWPAVRDARGWRAARNERDRLLGASDWTQMPDAPLTASVKQAWADYRQTLRDIPQTQDDPDSIMWPEQP